MQGWVSVQEKDVGAVDIDTSAGLVRIVGQQGKHMTFEGYLLHLRTSLVRSLHESGRGQDVKAPHAIEGIGRAVEVATQHHRPVEPAARRTTPERRRDLDESN